MCLNKNVFDSSIFLRSWRIKMKCCDYRKATKTTSTKMTKTISILILILITIRMYSSLCQYECRRYFLSFSLLSGLQQNNCQSLYHQAEVYSLYGLCCNINTQRLTANASYLYFSCVYCAIWLLCLVSIGWFHKWQSIAQYVSIRQYDIACKQIKCKIECPNPNCPMWSDCGVGISFWNKNRTIDGESMLL